MQRVGAKERVLGTLETMRTSRLRLAIPFVLCAFLTISAVPARAAQASREPVQGGRQQTVLTISGWLERMAERLLGRADAPRPLRPAVERAAPPPRPQDDDGVCLDPEGHTVPC